MKKKRGIGLSTFNNIVERRHTNSLKWDRMNAVYGVQNSEDLLPMWVADMDFAAPKVVIDAIQERLAHGILGYSFVSEEEKDAVRHWLADRHQWKIENDWLLFHQGVVPAIASIIETFTENNDGILITTPVYPPFFNIPGKLNREIIESQMLEHNGVYSLNFEDFEQKLQRSKLFILCNPHNPGGIVWKEDELKKIIELCTKHDVLILSDEIHADLVFQPNKHIALSTIAGEEANRIITCIAPTKTFNLAGVQAAIIISPDPEKRKMLAENAAAHGLMGLNIFAAVAMRAAFEHGGPWLEELLGIVSQNMDYAIEELNKLPGIRANKPDGTYLLWIDYRDTGLTEQAMMQALLQKGNVALEPGTKYGEAGRGFLRMNLACPSELATDGVQRFIRALS